MSWLYPTPQPTSFWSRRYARLFPAFLVMVVSLSLINNAHFSPFVQIMIVLGVASIARLIWELCLKVKIRFLTISFIILQIITALWYSFYLLNIPSPIFYQTWDKNLQILITALINGTLTLPFGNYIGQIDGVYWSLVTEVSFYLLYPILFVPLFVYINQQKSLIWKSLLSLSCLPFCWGLFFISQRTPGFSVMIPYLYIYFIVGSAIGSNLSWFQSKLKTIHHPLWLILLLLILFSGPLFFSYFSKFYSPLIYLAPVFPMSILVVGLSIKDSNWGKYFSSKLLTTLGKYSYSLYLTHALCIDILKQFLSGPFLVIAVFTLSGILSWCLYHLIEKPYYLLPKLNIPSPQLSKTFSRIVYIFSIVSTAVVYLVYRPPLSLFTYVIPTRSVSSITLTPNTPVTLSFVATKNNFGMITSHILDLGSPQSVLSISLLDSQKQLISQSNFNPTDIIENRFHPLGFPLIPDSQGKTYFVKYELVSSNSQSVIQIVTHESTFNSVYFINKTTLIKHPSELFSWTIAKVSEPFLNPMFWFCLVCVLPLPILLLIKPSKQSTTGRA